jgi:hypothetical protein
MESNTVPTLLNTLFWSAVLLTGTIEAAEAAVLCGIDESEDLSHRVLLISVIKAARRQRTRTGDTLGATDHVPPALRNVCRLPPVLRDCLVLHILLRLPFGECAELLALSPNDLTHAMFDALNQLALGSSNA